MRRLFLLAAVLAAFAVPAMADGFPGPKVRDSAPFNNTNIMTLGATACPGAYTAQEYATNKRKIINDVKNCIRDYLGINKDLGYDFGASVSHADCVIPEGYDARPPSNNPVWPVCCAVDSQGSYRMICKLYVTSQ